MKPSPPRIPKGSKEGGRFQRSLAKVQKLALAHETDLSSINRVVFKHSGLIGEQKAEIERLGRIVTNLSSRLGTSTPLIIWNIAVLVAIAGLSVAVAKLYGVAP